MAARPLPGIPWKEGNVQGLYYYVQPKIDYDNPDVEITNPTVGIFVPDGPYQPVKMSVFALPGRLNVDGKATPINLICGRSFTFYPPVRPGQSVPSKHASQARNAGQVGYIVYGPPGDYTIQSLRSSKTPKRPESPRDYKQTLTHFGGPKRYETGKLPHGYNLPRRITQQGQPGYFFKPEFRYYEQTVPEGELQTGSILEKWKRQDADMLPEANPVFVPHTSEYQPVPVTPSRVNVRIQVEDTDPETGQPKLKTLRSEGQGMQFQYFPPRLPGQSVPRPYHTLASHVDKSPYNTDPRNRTFAQGEPVPLKKPPKHPLTPEPTTKNGVKGHIFQVQFPPQKVPLSGGINEVRGKPRRYRNQLVVGRYQGRRLFVPFKSKYPGPRKIKPEGTMSVYVKLDPMPGERDTAVFDIPTPAGQNFLFYPPLMAGQTCEDKYRLRADPKQTNRVVAIDQDGNEKVQYVDKSVPFTPEQMKEKRRKKRKRFDYQKRALENSFRRGSQERLDAMNEPRRKGTNIRPSASAPSLTSASRSVGKSTSYGQYLTVPGQPQRATSDSAITGVDPDDYETPSLYGDDDDARSMTSETSLYEGESDDFSDDEGGLHMRPIAPPGGGIVPGSREDPDFPHMARAITGESPQADEERRRRNNSCSDENCDIM
ncbi:hypothetical protein HDE_04985 [Halotydeus destructor]|nr:hypothetical protein HDE_04985 [Halotydeus destructor]